MGSTRSGLLGSVVALAVAVGLVACAPTAARGPIKFGGTPGLQCVSVPAGGQALVGDVFVVPKDGAYRLQSVKLVGASGLSLRGGWVLPMDHGDAIGSAAYPATTQDWAARTPADGAVVEGASPRNVVLLVRRSRSARGTASGMEITYSSSDGSFAAKNTTRYELADRCD